MNTETRIDVEDNIMTVVMKMSEGNPGCMQFLMQFIKTIPEATMFILHFDSLGLYGSRLYMRWNDCCGRDCEKVAEVMRKRCAGELTGEEILNHVSDVYGTPFDFQNKEEIND